MQNKIVHVFLCLGFLFSSVLAQNIANDDYTGQSFYQLTPLNIGAQVHDLDLTTDVDPEVVKQIVHDTYIHKILVFKNQERISAKRHVEITKWFGDELDIAHRQHPKAEHPNVFRVSNDEQQGFTHVGNRGYHIDGYLWEKPHKFVMYYMPHIARKGNTVFVDLNKVVEGLSTTQRIKWDAMYTSTRIRPEIVHPLVYTHPITRKQTICINLDRHLLGEFILNFNSSKARTLSNDEFEDMWNEIKYEFEKYDGAYIYSHKWEEGDFVMTDNLSLAHIADADTQVSIKDIGLRVLHRVSVTASLPPMKNPPFLEESPFKTKEEL